MSENNASNHILKKKHLYNLRKPNERLRATCAALFERGLLYEVTWPEKVNVAQRKFWLVGQNQNASEGTHFVRFHCIITC